MKKLLLLCLFVILIIVILKYSGVKDHLTSIHLIPAHNHSKSQIKKAVNKKPILEEKEKDIASLKKKNIYFQEKSSMNFYLKNENNNLKEFNKIISDQIKFQMDEEKEKEKEQKNFRQYIKEVNRIKERIAYLKYMDRIKNIEERDRIMREIKLKQKIKENLNNKNN